MENRLKKQLSGLEFKPSEALWDKISKNLSGDFERELNNKLEDFAVTPNEEVWEKVAVSIPENQNGNASFPLIALLIVALTSSALATYLLVSSPSPLMNKNTAIKSVSIPEHKLSLPKKGNIHPQLAINKIQNTITNSSSKPAETRLRLNILDNNKVTEKNASSDLLLPKSKNVISGHTLISTSALITEPNTAKNKMISTNQIKPSNVLASSKKDNGPLKENETKPIESLAKVLTNTKSDTGIALVSSPSSSSNKIEPIPNLIAPTIQSDKDSTSIAKATSISGLIADDEKLTRFSISVMAGVNYCFNALVAPSTNTHDFSKNIALRQSVETPDVDWSGQFLLNYELNNRWSITAGIGILNFNQQFLYNITSPSAAGPSIDRNAVLINPNDSIVNGSTYSTRIKYSWTEFPLMLSYKLTRRQRWNFELQGGISFALLSTSDAGVINYDNVGILMLRDKSAFPGLSNSWFFTLCPSLNYRINKTVALAVHPSFKTALNSMIADKNWVQQFPYMAGMYLSLRKQF